MKAMELLSGYVTAPDTTLTALTMGSGNSLSLRSAKDGSRILLLNTWVDCQTAGVLQIRSPYMHDNTNNLRFKTIASDPTPLMPQGIHQQLQHGDTLIAELSGSATSGDIESAAMLVWYDDLPGVDGHFIEIEELENRMEKLLTIENTLALGTGGGYSGNEAINAEYDNLKGNREYAIIGYQVSAECAAVRWRSSDFGELGIGGPGIETDRKLTSSWFLSLAWHHSLPCIPVFNSANKASLIIDGVQDENGTDVTVSTIACLLREQ